MSLSKVLSPIGLFLCFLPISYLVGDILWFSFVDGKLFFESDPILPFTDFLPPFIHNCCGDYYFPGWNEQKVAEIGRFYMYGIILLSVLLSIIFSRRAGK